MASAVATCPKPRQRPDHRRRKNGTKGNRDRTQSINLRVTSASSGASLPLRLLNGMTQPLKLLYLGFAFPPGVAGRFPEAQPAGHLIETSLVNSLRTWFEIRSVGISWIRVEDVPP